MRRSDEHDPRTVKGRAAHHVLLALAASLLINIGSYAQGGQQREPDKDTRAMIEASYIYNIAKLVQWRDEGMRRGPFIIGVIGSTNLYQELVNKYAMRSIGKQPIEVRKLPEMAEVDACHILFIPAANRNLLAPILKQPNARATLIITDFPDALANGAVVNFIPARNTLKYEINLANAEKHRIEVGLTLRQLADRVVE